MGNALDAAKFSASQGLTGVSDPTASLSAITEGIETISDWKTKRDEAKEKLKKDTADQYLEAEKKAYENMPTDKTFKSNILEGLDSYKERLYTNMKLVQRGVVSANDNLIFRENATQGIGVVSDMQKNYAKIQENYLKGARGYTDDKGNYVPPIYGAGAAALNDIHVQLNNPDLYSLTFNEKGSAEIIMYETEVSPNNIMVAKKDENGNRIPIEGGNINAMAFDGGNNQVMNLMNLSQVSTQLTGEGTVFARDFQDVINTKGMMGVITDDIKANKKDGLGDLISSTAVSMTTGVDQRFSILSDNGPLDKRSKGLSPRMYKMLTAKQKAETIEYDYFNFETGLMDKGEKTKYIPLVMGANNQYVPEFKDRDMEASTNLAEYSLYNSLEKSVKSAGSQRQKPTTKIGSEKKAESRYNLLKKGLSGDYTSLQSLVDQVSQDKNSTVKGFRTDPETNQMFIVRKDGSEGGAIDLKGNLVQIGQRIAGQLGIGAEGFASLGLGSDLQISDKVVDYDAYSITAAATPYAAIENKYSPILLKSFAEVDEGGRAISPRARKINAEAQISTMMRDLGVTDELVIGELIENSSGVVSGGGRVFIGGVEIGNLTDAKTLPGILRAITNKARETANSGGSMSSFNSNNQEEE
jgi:hypothetical protein